MAGNSYFSEDLGGGYSMNIQTGEILNSNNGQVYPNADALRQGVATMSAQPQSQGGGGNVAGGVGGSLGTGLAGYQLYNQALTQGGSQALGQGGTQVLAQGGSQAIGQGGSQAVGTAMNGGTMMADGTIQGGSQAVGGSATGAIAGGVAFNAMAAYEAQKKARENYQTYGSKNTDEAVKDELKETATGGWYRGTSPGELAMHVLPWTQPIALTAAVAGSLFGSKHAAARKARKGARTRFQDVGLMNTDSRSRYNLADGSQFDIAQYRQNTGNHAFNINHDEVGAGDKVGRLGAITSGLYGGGKMKDQMTGELYNSYNSNGQFDQNFRAATDRMGGRDVIYQGILDRWKLDKTFTADQRDAALAAIDKEYGIANPTNQRWDASLTGKDAERNQKEFAEAEKKRQEQAAKNPQAKPMATNMPVNAKPFPFSPPVKPVAQNQSINPRLKGRR